MKRAYKRARRLHKKLSPPETGKMRKKIIQQSFSKKSFNQCNLKSNSDKDWERRKSTKYSSRKKQDGE